VSRPKARVRLLIPKVQTTPHHSKKQFTIACTGPTGLELELAMEQDEARSDFRRDLAYERSNKAPLGLIFRE
jgi:hypothetical protein